MNSFDRAWDEPGRRPTRLRDLVAAVPGSHHLGDALVAGVAHDSRTVREGDLFLAFPGAHHDGRAFVAEAVARGAHAVVVDQPVEVGCAQLVVPSVVRAAGPVSAALYGEPSRRVPVLGVTGTNGKTTTAQLLRALLATPDRPVAQIGTTGIYLGEELVADSELSTPQAPDLQRLFAALAARGAGVIAMEVTSQGLHRHRVDGTHFRLGLFLNLSPEHLDYHGSMEEYFEAKARLFDPAWCEEALVCVDDEWGRRLAASLEIPVTTFGREEADVIVNTFSRGLEGLEVRVTSEEGAITLRSALVGRVNGANVAAAYLAARRLGVAQDVAGAAIEGAAPPPGRFEVLTREDEPYLVVADYAHTPNALAALLGTAREIAPGRVHSLFGARGGRYLDKRPKMVRAAGSADRLWLTSDSPGEEDPTEILEHLQRGLRGDERVSVEIDRAAAIAAAVAELEAGDVLVLSGRGPEATQHFGAREVLLDDRVRARLALDGRRRVARGEGGVAVVVWARDVEDHLAGTLEAVRAQSWPVGEVVVVDDGSSDGTARVVERHFPGVVLHRQPARGRPFSFNLGAARTGAPWIAFVEAGQSLSPEWVEQRLVTCWAEDAALCGAAGDEGGPLLVRRDLFGAVGGFAHVDEGAAEGLAARLGALGPVLWAERDPAAALAPVIPAPSLREPRPCRQG